MAIILLGLIGAVLAAPAASAAVRVSRAEVSGSKLRLEGTADPGRAITVDGVAMGTSDASGAFRIERDGFTPPADCTVDVNDGSASAATATLSGCTVSAPPPSSQPTLSAVRVDPSEVIQGQSATGSVAISAAAPAAGFTIDLVSDNPTVATVPANVTVPAGSTGATFAVSTNPHATGSALIIGTVGGDWNTHKYAIITTYTEFHYNHGSISILPGGNGSGRVTSQPEGIDCTITNGNGSGTCWTFFPVGTVVRLEGRPAEGSEFRGWKTNLPGCSDPSKVTVTRGTTITCQPGFFLK